MHETGFKSVPIAIIGMGCRFAGDATNPEKLWKTLHEGKSAWSEIPPSRFHIKGWYHPNYENISTTHVRGGHFLQEDPALFDAAFFGLSSETASTMDPQYRLLLESVYEALENAGIPMEQVAESNTSVFSGAFFHDYQDGYMRDAENLPRFLMSGNGAAIASNRVSHFFDLCGPSMTIDTGCSTTLTALHQACQGLRAGDADMSIVGGSNLLINPDNFMAISSVGMLSPDGKSYSFDSRANGYGRGEGVASIVIKRLDDAIKAGDPIRTIIRETLLNQDGKTETITSPSSQAQENLIRLCYGKAGLDPASVQYFEAHGTGTPTGDPIEVGAIASIFKEGRSPEKPLYIGSVKTNLGHTEPTSGLASVIKVALALERNLIPPNINFEKPNKHLALREWNLKIPLKCESWPVGTDGVRRASVNNFGYGGANAHVILEEWPSHQTRAGMGCDNVNLPLSTTSNGSSSSAAQSKLFILSAKDERACRTMAFNLKDYLQEHGPGIDKEGRFLNDLAHTLGHRRSRFSWVSTCAASSIPELVMALDDTKLSPSRSVQRPRLGFAFTGQGAQWHAMGRELLEAYPVFKASIVEAEMYLKAFGCIWSLQEELLRDAENSRINDTSFGMPLCAAVQISLVRLLEAWGVTPTAVCSHSSGEIAAAYAIGALSFRSAMAVSYCRSEVTSELKNRVGGMIAVGLGVSAVEEYLKMVKDGEAKVACINSPSSVTVSGDISAIKELERLLTAQNIFARRLRVRTAFHSDHMLPLYDPYLNGMREIGISQEHQTVRPIIYASPTTGTRVLNTVELSDPEHWVKSMISPVLFLDAFRHMALNPTNQESEIDIVVEIGPHAALSGPIGDILLMPEFREKSITYLPTLVRKVCAVDTMQALAGHLLCRGFPVELKAVNFPLGMNGVSVISDLPPYPWNHLIRHWSEPRVNRCHRNKQFEHHDLLGSLVEGTNPLLPTWRHVLRSSDVAWVREHTVQSNLIYPGAGYVCMAIEAVRQISQATERAISGYRLRNVDILQALVVPEGPEGIEVQLTLGSILEEAIGLRGWKEFRIFSATLENRWTEHCKGYIHVDFRDSSEDVARSELLRLDHKHSSLSGYSKRVNPAEIYARMRSNAIYHGPIFQNLRSVLVSDRQAVGTISIADVAAVMPAHYQHDHILHPTTLDSVFVSAYGPLTGGNLQNELPKVPKLIKELWVSHKIDSQAGHTFKSHARVHHSDSKTFKSSIILMDADMDDNVSNGPVLIIDGLVCQSLGATIPCEPDPHKYDLCSTLKWAPDISFMDFDLLRKDLSFTVDPKDESIVMDLRRACFHFVYAALASLTLDDVKQLEWHHKKFYTWMKLLVNLALSGELAPSSSDWVKANDQEKKRLFDAVSSSTVNGEVVCRLGPQIVSILRGQTTSLELLMEDKLLHKYHRNAPEFFRRNVQLSQILKHLIHKRPRAKILEIGAGTGGTTQCLLEAIGNGKGSGYGPFASEYHFTDVSSTLFADAQSQFKEWGDLLIYRTLDIEFDPAIQGFECGSFDIIIASQVFYGTENMETSMANMRNLLQPGGRLLLMGSTNGNIDMQFTFGLLSSRWLTREEERMLGLSFSTPSWDKAFRDAGFSGIDLEVHDCENEQAHSLDIIMSTAAENLVADNFDPVALVTSQGFKGQDVWLRTLQDSIAAFTGENPPRIETIDSIDAKGKVCVLLEIDQPLLERPSSVELEAIRRLALDCKMLFWVTRGGAVDCEKPELALSSGFMRSLRQEDSGKVFIAIDLDPSHAVLGPQDASVVTKILGGVTNQLSLGNPIREVEFAHRDDLILIPRLMKDYERNDHISSDAKITSEYSLESFLTSPHHPECIRKLEVGIPGLLETLRFTEAFAGDNTMDPEHIEIEPKAFGLNFRDVMGAMGQLDEMNMGLECSGIITRVGAGAASHGFFVGCRVIALLSGQFMNRIRIPWTLACPMPDLDFETAASIPMAFATAYISLYDTARISKGQSVLIHAASGGVGQAAIILSQLVGAEVFATAGTLEKRRFINSRYGIPEDHIFSSRDATFATRLMSMTSGHGVDVVLNSLSGHLLQESFNCLAPFGHFVEIGKFDLEHNHHLQMLPFSRIASFSSINLLALTKMGSPFIHRALTIVTQLLEQQAIYPVHPITVFPMADVEKAFRQMQAGRHMGKIVLSLNNQLVPIMRQKPSVRLKGDASYLITGGVGGIGKSVANWLLVHGARSLILMSRNAAAGESTASFVADLEATHPGARVKAISCDISNANELASALLKCGTELPPIRGVIQAAMVLQDSILENMTINNYNAAILPKVQGTWNLHTHLNQDLDFFIMISSIAGVIGNASQSNYTAGGAFQDALARHRIAKGLPGVALDIGAVKDVGYVASNQSVYNHLERIGYRLLGEDEVLLAIESAILSPSAQIVVGINMAAGSEKQDTVLSRDARFDALRNMRSTSTSGSISRPNIAAGSLAGQLASASTLEEASSLIMQVLVKKLVEIFIIPIDEVIASKSMADFGVDSLVAVELRNMLALQAGAEISIFELLQSPSLAALSHTVASTSSYVTVT